MKKILVGLAIISSTLLINSSFAYLANKDDNTKLETIYKKIDKLYSEKKINKIVIIKNKVNKLIEKNREKERNMYLLRQIKNKLIIYIEKDKKEKELEAKKINENKNITLKQKLLKKYWSELNWEISAICIKNYDFIDKIAKEQNFPTELIIAMWKKEHNCHLDNPSNWWWAFQITSKYYKPWEISLEEFKTEIIDFINFSKNKINYYNKDIGKFKAYFGKENILLTYDTFSARDIRLYGLLYNWIKKTTNLETFLFANANLKADLKSNSDWIFTLFLKVIKSKTK